MMKNSKFAVDDLVKIVGHDTYYIVESLEYKGVVLREFSPNKIDGMKMSVGYFAEKDLVLVKPNNFEKFYDSEV